MCLAYIWIVLFFCLFIGDTEEKDVDMKEDSGIKFMILFSPEGQDHSIDCVHFIF